MEYNMIIREASQNDLLAIEEIERECFSNPWNIDSLKSEFSKEFSSILVAKKGEKTAVGYIIIHLIDDFAEIQRIATDPRYRKEGVGTKLVDYTFEYLYKKKKIRILLEVNENNIPAINLYKKKGFIEISVRKNYYGKESALIFEKKLSKENEN